MSQPESLVPSCIVTVGAVEYTVVVPQATTDYIQGRLAETGHPYEESMLKVMAERLSPGDLVLDVGANIGNHTLYLAAVAECKVIAYEPNPELVAGMRASIVANGFESLITLREVGVGSRAGYGAMGGLNPANLGAQHIEFSDTGGDFAVVALDDETFTAPVAAMKIDVEGAEVNVLRGARKRIMADRPMLFVECGTKESFEAVETLLTGWAYSLVGTYNATPTHLFLPSETPGIAQEVYDRLLRLTAEIYDVERAKAALRSQVARTHAEGEAARNS